MALHKIISTDEMPVCTSNKCSTLIIVWCRLLALEHDHSDHIAINSRSLCIWQMLATIFGRIYHSTVCDSHLFEHDIWRRQFLASFDIDSDCAELFRHTRNGRTLLRAKGRALQRVFDFSERFSDEINVSLIDSVRFYWQLFRMKFINIMNIIALAVSEVWVWKIWIKINIKNQEFCIDFQKFQNRN